MPHSFENLSLTCKSLYNASPALRQKHNNLKRRYQHFAYDIYPDEPEEQPEPGSAREAEETANHLASCYSSLQLLLRIADEPLIMEYMVTADFKNDLHIINDNLKGLIEEQTLSSTNLLSLLQKSTYLQKAGIDPKELRRSLSATLVEEDNIEQGLAAVFLLTLLPNVTALAIPQDWEGYGWEDATDILGSQALKTIAERANDPNDPTASLSKLKSILPSKPWGYESHTSLALYNPLLAIKTVTSVVVSSCEAIDDSYTGDPFPDPTERDYGVNVEELVLATSVVGAKEMRTLLKRLPKLRSLKFSHETKWHGCGHDMNPGTLMSAIKSAAGDRLESLSFSIYESFWDSKKSIRSMKEFAKLKDLEIGLNVLAGVKKKGNPLKMGDLLPKSLERLCILVHDFEGYFLSLGKLMDGAAADKNESLPNLKELVIRCTEKEVVDLITETIALQKSESNFPQWKKDLIALGESVSISVVQLEGENRALASFMDGFCEKYGVKDES